MASEKQKKLDEYEVDALRLTEAIDVLKDVRNDIWKKRDALFWKEE